MLLVVDTNIIVNYLKSKSEKALSICLMEDIFAKKHIMCVSSAIMREYEEVLHRDYLKLPKSGVDWLLSWIRQNSVFIEPLPTTPRTVEMRHDETDRVFFDVAKCLNVKLITRNRKHYPIHELITDIEELYPSHGVLEGDKES